LLATVRQCAFDLPATPQPRPPIGQVRRKLPACDNPRTFLPLSGRKVTFRTDSRMNRKLAIAMASALGLAVAVAAAQTRPAAPAANPQAAAIDALVRASLTKAIPGVKIDAIRPSQIPGYREVAVNGGKVVYASNDGRYLLQGQLVELATRDNLTAVSEGALRRGKLDAVGKDRRIIFSPAKPKHRVTVFTDIDCGYCRKLHAQIDDYMKAGIAVEYLFFPRAGINSASYNDAVSVWCAADPRKALTDAKADRPVAKKTCANPVAKDFELGRQIGVDGTPAIYAADGTQIGGYLTPQEMLEKLDRQASRMTAAR